MPFSVATSRFVALLMVSVTTCCVLYWFTNDTLFSQNWVGLRTADTTTVGSFKTAQEEKHNLPLTDAQRRRNSLATAQSKAVSRESRREDTIVLRHGASTATSLEPKPAAGRLSAYFMGRIGNWMNIYAGLYAIARRNGMRHVIYADNPLLKLFRLNATVLRGNDPDHRWVRYVVKRGYDQYTEHLNPRVDVELVGYFNNLKYYKHVFRDLVQNHFRFHKSILREADDFLRRSIARFNISTSQVAVIGVHIRRTDMLHIRVKAGRSADVAGRDYLRHAVSFFNSLFKNKTMYVVCSDDLVWAMRNFVTERPTVFSVGHRASVDFAILCRCNHSIITMGTYGKWSAYIAGGVTVFHQASAPTEVPLDVIDRKLNSDQSPTRAWIAMS